ncbi:tryptophan halogenase family protein [Hyphococcus luteus]|uniref:Tryptophan halogenase n=1 Tax=Hyphococcus luteus TaxID=2058213 RepID=A0A2S7K0T6_9PROT|nr:tryptophan halogenase family protein [Marinicaulis flavus]PQA86086.1 tryptophan halogenase [Marinicaulis flavus]
MHDQRVKKVVIAGGGTAGWCAAAALTSQLGPLIDVTLVESEDIGTVGVGEATIPTIRTFHHLLGIDERAFMRATQASFKLAIMFENWARLGDRYLHSFGQIGKPTWMGGFHNVWLQARAEGLAGEIGDYCFEHEAAKAGKFFTSPEAKINYAYHLDAGLYGRFLREFSETKGAKRIEGKIQEVEQRPDDGFISALVMESGERVEGDLFIDCTGFRGLLIEQTLKAGYEDWSHWLPTDSAIALQTASVGPAPPYTRASAHEAGWRWRIPLRHRVGNGAVFCSRYLSDDEARAYLLGAIDGEPITEPRLIRYRTGKRRKAWIKNCVALGLSSGFVEPLESTSIHLIQIGLTRLIQLFPFSGCHNALVRRYNEQADVELERVRDFIILHYKLTERDDSPFWRRCRDMEIPDTLAQRIALFRDDAYAYQGPEDLFRVDSWLQVMLGQRLEPQGRHHLGRLMTREQMQGALDSLKNNIADAVAKMPDHQTFLEQYYPPAEA